MRSILCALIFCSLSISGFCQENGHLSFMGIPITGSSELFIKQLESKGFIKTDEFESSYNFIGKFANEIVELSLLASPRTRTACKVIVSFPQKNSWVELKQDYFKKKRLYKSKYLLTDEFEFFSSPYEDGDGYELRAVVSDRCSYSAFFVEDGGHIGVQISPEKCVKVTYEDDDNMRIAKEELEYNAFEDI